MMTMFSLNVEERNLTFLEAVYAAAQELHTLFDFGLPMTVDAPDGGAAINAAAARLAALLDGPLEVQG